MSDNPRCPGCRHYNAVINKVCRDCGFRAETVDEVLARFPERFGLRGFPGDVFRCSTQSSYIGDDGRVVVYTERQKESSWLAFAKGSEAEIWTQLVRL